MFNHVAMFRWLESASQSQRQAVPEALAGLPEAVPTLRQYRFGPDAGTTEGNWDFVAVASFDDIAGWEEYTRHPAHKEAIASFIRPITSERAAIQFFSD
jgi:hypothetical protein